MMDKKELLYILNSIFEPIGFTRKGNTWTAICNDLSKIIQLQKSYYGNIYYLDYGYIINKLELGKLRMHIYNRLSSPKESENHRIKELFNFENSISDNERQHEISKIIELRLIKEIQRVNNEQDLIKSLKKRPHLNDVPLVVKKHYGL